MYCLVIHNFKSKKYIFSLCYHCSLQCLKATLFYTLILSSSHPKTLDTDITRSNKFQYLSKDVGVILKETCHKHIEKWETISQSWRFLSPLIFEPYIMKLEPDCLCAEKTPKRTPFKTCFVSKITIFISIAERNNTSIICTLLTLILKLLKGDSLNGSIRNKLNLN